jgi:hypothetical protein
MVTGMPAISRRIATKSSLHRHNLLERAGTLLRVLGHDHFAHRLDAAGAEEHMLGAAEADALGAEFARDFGIARSVGVSAQAEAALTISPFHELAEMVRHHGLHGRHAAGDHFAGAAVERKVFASPDDPISNLDRAGAVVDIQRRAAGDTALAHPARDHRRMAGHAAAGGQDTLGDLHPMDVLRGGFDADENCRTTGVAHDYGFVGGEDDLAVDRAG